MLGKINQMVGSAPAGKLRMSAEEVNGVKNAETRGFSEAEMQEVDLPA